MSLPTTIIVQVVESPVTVEVGTIITIETGGGGGGSGVDTYAELTDKATVNLPTINTPLADALAGKSATSHNHTGVYDPAGSAAAVEGDLSSHAGDTNNPHSVTASQVGLGSVDNTADADKPVSILQQAALDLKAPLDSPDFTGTTTFAATETGSATRPVAMGMNFIAAPATPPVSSTDFHGVDIVLRNTTNGNSLSRLYPFESTATYQGSGTIGALYGGYFQASNTSTGTATESTALRLWTQNTGNGTIGTARGLYIQNPNNTGSGTITNHYGIFIEAQSAATTDNFGIYSLAARNYLAGLTTNSQTTNATSLPAAVFNQSVSPGTDAVTINVTHTANHYPFRVANAGAYGPIFTTTTNSGDTLTVRKNGTGAGVVAKIINQGTGNSLEVGPSGSPNVIVSSTGAITGTEQASPPSAPAANGFVIYAEDNGSGKTRLMVRFATGAAQQIALEP